MKRVKRTNSKPFLNRKETQSLLTTLKVVSATGALSLTLAGWGMLAQAEANNPLQTANQNQTQAVALSSLPLSTPTTVFTAKPLATPTPQPSPTTATQVRRLNVVQWVQDMQGNQVAVVQGNGGTLWYVMGSDVPRIEQGLAPLVQPQQVRRVTRTRAS